jgi:hypothetical protein
MNYLCTYWEVKRGKARAPTHAVSFATWDGQGGSNTRRRSYLYRMLRVYVHSVPSLLPFYSMIKINPRPILKMLRCIIVLIPYAKKIVGQHTIMSHIAHIKLLWLHYCATIASTHAASAYHSSATRPYNSTDNLYVLWPREKTKHDLERPHWSRIQPAIPPLHQINRKGKNCS